jgi:hypothetical protein
MNSDEIAQGEAEPVSCGGGGPAGAGSQETPGSRHPRASAAYRLCERLTEATLYGMVFFSPWAFGTTQPWAVWVMNVAGCLLGGLLAAKGLVRWTTGYCPVLRHHSERQKRLSGSLWLGPAMAVLTVSFLLYVLAGALNARAAFDAEHLDFEYFKCIPWLPHSYDRAATWFEFWEYLGLACAFWAARDWLRGAPAAEPQVCRMRAGRSTAGTSHRGPRVEGQGTVAPPLDIRHSAPGRRIADEPGSNVRLRRLLMVICITGMLTGLEGIVQRLSGSDKLLFLVQPRYNMAAVNQFGPYANRNNAAEYFNLIWPVCAGFAWLEAQSAKRARKEGRRKPGTAHLWLAMAALITGVCPLMSGSRGGTLVSLAMVVVVLVVMLVVPRRVPARNKIGLGLLFAAALLGSVVLGWDNLQARLQTIFTDNLSGRLAVYKDAAAMARDYPVLGSGAGTYASLYYLYRGDPNGEWSAYLHNDWLEYRITLGWLGFSLLLGLLTGALFNWFIGSGPPLPTLLAALIWIAMAGCLLHARFDLPFRVYSVAALFLLYCSILSSAGRGWGKGEV